MKNILSIVIPIYNEEESLQQVVPELIELCDGYDWKLILVDDGSLDKSGDILENYQETECVEIFTHRVNHGYGGALKTGIERVETEFLLTFDADGQHSKNDINKILQYGILHQADLVVGSRSEEEMDDKFRLLGKSIIRVTAGYLMKLPIKDLNSGFKLYRTELAKKYIGLCPDSMAFSDIITLIFINQRHYVTEFPIKIKKRLAGKSTINIFTAYNTLENILNIAMMFNPLKFFLPLSFISLLVGFGWGLPIVIMGRGVSVGSVLAIITGVLIFIIGLLASQLSAIRLQLINDSTEKRTRQY